MKFILRMFVIILPIALISFFYLYINDDDYYPGADYRNYNLPQFELNELYSQSPISNKDLQGTYLINVWASWCITCRVEHGFLVKLSNKNIPIMGINYKDDRDDAINWINKFGDPYKLIIHDFKGSLALDMGVTGAPETFLVSNGEVLVHYRGEVNTMIWQDVFTPVINKYELFK
jgi:cytochrome c biogenesis protein CcmG/thiol:disulfide interchange protein DsbE|tara:strand:+ start:12955 stop:13479 length:525 start_codon:yes stop_codon:yes gene_type:complete